MTYRTSLPLHPTEDGKPKKIGGKQGPRAGERDKGGKKEERLRKAGKRKLGKAFKSSAKAIKAAKEGKAKKATRKTLKATKKWRKSGDKTAKARPSRNTITKRKLPISGIGQSTTGFMKGAAKRKKEDRSKKATESASKKAREMSKTRSRLRGLQVPTRLGPAPQ